MANIAGRLEARLLLRRLFNKIRKGSWAASLGSVGGGRGTKSPPLNAASPCLLEVFVWWRTIHATLSFTPGAKRPWWENYHSWMKSGKWNWDFTKYGLILICSMHASQKGGQMRICVRMTMAINKFVLTLALSLSNLTRVVKPQHTSLLSEWLSHSVRWQFELSPHLSCTCSPCHHRHCCWLSWVLACSPRALVPSWSCHQHRPSLSPRHGLLGCHCSQGSSVHHSEVALFWSLQPLSGQKFPEAGKGTLEKHPPELDSQRPTDLDCLLR